MTDRRSTTHEAMTLELRPLSPVFFYVVLAFFGIGYVVFVSQRSSNAQIAFLGWGAFLALYCGVLGFYVDRAVIDRARGCAVVQRGVGPFVSEARFALERASCVSIAMTRGHGTRFAYHLGLWDGEAKEEFRLVGQSPLERAWERAVAVARYLDLPVFDRMAGGRVWSQGSIPETIEERLARLRAPEPKGH